MTDASGNKSRGPSNASYLGRLALPVLWAAIISWLSLTSTPPLIPGVLGWDKLQHAAAYVLLTLSVAQYLHIHCADSRKTGFSAACLAVAYGGLMEIMQLATQTGRQAELWDLAADAVGSVAGYVIFRQAVLLLSRCHARDKAHG
jgi:VanZ family protein